MDSLTYSLENYSSHIISFKIKIIEKSRKFFFNWDSLHARMSSYYEAWSSKQEKEAQKIIQ